MAFPRSNNTSGNPTGATKELAIKGWTNSKLSSNKDQGLDALLIFLEKKSSRRILQSRMAGRAVLIITVNENDTDRFHHLNNFTWAGSTLIVEDARPPGTRNQSQPSSRGGFNQNGPNRGGFHQNGGPHSQNQPAPTGPRRGGGNFNNNTFNNDAASRAPNGPRNTRGGRNNNGGLTDDVENLIISVLRKRYHAGDKHLILNTLVSDPDMLNSGLAESDAGKVYRAIFTICETKIWETEPKRTEAVLSVSLRDNGIKSVQDIISLASTFPHLQNLDLANNSLEDMGALKFWKNQFRDLEHLILTGNPVASKPDTLSTLLRWYPKLKMYNNEPIANNGAGVQSQPQAQPQPAFTPSFQQGVATPPVVAPPQSTTPVPQHPELPPGSTFAVPLADKPAEILLREQMGLQFSFETKLKMEMVENCLTANNWDYAAAMANFLELRSNGMIPADAYLVGV